MEVLQALRGADSAKSDTVQQEYTEIVEVVKSELSLKEKGNFLTLFFGKASGKLHLPLRANLAFWLQIMMEWNGITAVTVFSPTIYAQAGYGKTKSDWLSALTNTTGILGTIVAALTIDRFGRRKVMFVGAVCLGVTMFLTGGFDRLLITRPAQAERYGAVSVMWIFLYTLFYSSTWLMYVYEFVAEYLTDLTFLQGAFRIPNRDFSSGSSRLWQWIWSCWVRLQMCRYGYEC